jgi:hypothetical protein
VIPTIVKTDAGSQQSSQAITAIRPVTPVTPVKVVADPGNAEHGFVPGQHYQAIVEKRLPNGNYAVHISDKFLQMQLPGGAQPGDHLKLLFITNEPKPKFIVQGESAAYSKNNALISLVGKFLDSLVYQGGKLTAMTPAITTPILTNPLTNKQDSPLLLQKAIYQSGLFYESHLAKWVQGKYPFERLQLEPQNKLKTLTAEAVTTANAPASLAQTHTLPLVQQQLIALEAGHIMWRGEIWNGQQMEWNIYEDDNYHDSSVSNTVKQWRTRLTLTFPELGKITATLILNAQDIQIQLDASNPDIQSQLINSLNLLKTGLQAVGMVVTSFTLQSDD